ncbi:MULTISPECIES: phosphoenolpyruvate--protein phosphotransferase [unclassified Pseudonocardia]|uniref:phosphoenolpyruvate--protein phosphotransferase n=1 Tax=unclassified Pseudonocardia TaxID=2619320 RepID=UPI00094B65AB|nr:phosphoenolpyruvate--protein phosphotransferase [Pseudonocardia sp. Ae707_Ps1]OLM17430.1 Phosphoenolpyruvate-protein phosphotransferase of PTS system [Pseudonocardia sp. Ae707_Ps1]
MTVGIVVVSHSPALADAAVALAAEMVQGQDSVVECAAGTGDGGLGTDAVAIADAVTRADTGAGVVVLMDLGSAVLSAETALEFLDDDVRARVVLCPAPLVEGLVAATVTAASGAGTAEVAAEATAALLAKQNHLGEPTAGPPPDGGAAQVTARFTVAMLHGLHARPAAMVVRAVRGLDADVRLRNVTAGTAAVPARSLSQVATLGALRDHEIEILADGDDAETAVRALLALAGDGFGETSAPAPAAPPVVPDVPVAASPGIGIGPAVLAGTAAVAVPPPRAGPPEVQRERLAAACGTVRSALGAVRDRAARDIGTAEAAIFEAQLLLLDDPELTGATDARIAAGTDAARAWAEAVEEVERRFAAVADDYLQARAADVRDLRDQVLRALGGDGAPGAAADGVLLADDLTPARAAELDPARTVAVLLAHGSPTAHSVILLRARGIPAVVGAAGAIRAARPGVTVALDGSTGEVVVDPDDATLAGFRRRAGDRDRRRGEALARAGEPAVTRDGTTVLVGANLGSADDARAAAGADLAGLVRTEFCFLGRAAPPTVDEQEDAYRAIAEAMTGRRVTLRTLDVGGDKPLDYLPVAPEANPFLGVRGIRLALARPELLTGQLEAVVRVAHDHPVDVMFPMVSTLDELLAARGLLDRAVTTVGRGRPASLRVGIMVEVPATALKAAVFAPHVDFLSVGTNDLTQYALAAERGNEALAALADPLDPGVLALVAAAGAVAAPDLLVAVCGELAADPAAVPLLLGAGVRELSVSPAAVAETKQVVRGVDLDTARDLTGRALRAAGAAAVRALPG